MRSSPLVSCLCVTRKRINLLERSIQCFHSQTYPEKELIIICEDDDEQTVTFVKDIKHPQVRYEIIKSKPKLKLGELRNIAIETAKGEYFCQWDDDDWYHNERIERQLSAALDNKQPGTILTNWLIFDEMYKQAYLAWTRWWEGSVLFRKDILKEKNIRYPALEKQEDTLFIQDLVNKSKILPLVTPPIYIYTYHGKNTWERNQFSDHFNKSQKLSANTSLIVKQALSGELSNEEASKQLHSDQVLEELDFLHYFKTQASNVIARVNRI